MSRFGPARRGSADLASGPGYWSLAPAFATIFVVATTINFLAPLLLQLGSDLGTSLVETSQLVIATAVTWGIASPWTGLLGGRFGRRPVAVACLAGMGLVTLSGVVVRRASWPGSAISIHHASGGVPSAGR